MEDRDRVADTAKSHTGFGNGILGSWHSPPLSQAPSPPPSSRTYLHKAGGPAPGRRQRALSESWRVRARLLSGLLILKIRAAILSGSTRRSAKTVCRAQASPLVGSDAEASACSVLPKGANNLEEVFSATHTRLTSCGHILGGAQLIGGSPRHRGGAPFPVKWKGPSSSHAL